MMAVKAGLTKRMVPFGSEMVMPSIVLSIIARESRISSSACLRSVISRITIIKRRPPSGYAEMTYCLSTNGE
ncbi:MAG: hypothetical protein BWY76_02307 [bacterium ADurb.Bin429]|nr:MAG: hypothetical protein BWY76_02307 [bacterium ADurb.Bin429]